jgi:Zn-dependent M28 family amino/carboxypeptidase
MWLLGRATGAIDGPAWPGPLLAATSATALFALSTLRNGNESPGGVDNAGSVAIVVELAGVLAGKLPRTVELVLLLTSAEEDHMIGAMRFLDAHAHELSARPVQALNFDGAGSPGDAVILHSYGVYHRFAPEISDLALRIARRRGVRLRKVWMPPAIGIDAIPFHHRGLACLTFASGALGRATFAVHSSKDLADHLDPTALERVAGLAAEVATELSHAPRAK